MKDQAMEGPFLDIGSGELSHMEMVATTRYLLNGHSPGAGEPGKWNLPRSLDLANRDAMVTAN
jgi:Mn-containing catalase